MGWVWLKWGRTLSFEQNEDVHYLSHDTYENTQEPSPCVATLNSYNKHIIRMGNIWILL